MSAPSRATRAGVPTSICASWRARANGRSTSCCSCSSWRRFLDRLASSRFAEQLVLKGGVLLAAFEERRATRDIDLQSSSC